MKRLIPSCPVILLQILLGVVFAVVIGYLFRVNFYDYMQHDSDAAYFFEAASTGGFGLPFDAGLFDELLYFENILPLAVYGFIYGIFNDLGASADPLFGIAFNAALVAISQFIAAVYARKLFEFNSRELVSLTLLMSFNGVIMMFAGIHMRDAFLLLITTVAVLLFHPRSSPRTLGYHVAMLVWLVLLMAIAYVCRKACVMVPLLVYCSSIVVNIRVNRPLLCTGVTTLLLVISILHLSFDILRPIVDAYAVYRSLSETENSGGSLAYFFLYELPFPLSALASAALVFFIKVPFWRDMFYDSYSFFVSIAAFQMLFVAPVVLAVMLYTLLNRTDVIFRYLVFIVLGLLFAIAVTSSQVRHFAIIYPFVFLLYVARYRVVTNYTGIYLRDIRYGLLLTVIFLNVFTLFF